MTTSRTYCTEKHNIIVTVRNDGKGEAGARWHTDEYEAINPVKLFSATYQRPLMPQLNESEGGKTLPSSSHSSDFISAAVTLAAEL